MESHDPPLALTMASSSSETATPSVSTPPSTPLEARKALQCLQASNNVSRDAYSRWRPSFHLQPISGWINDPCAPGFDPKTGLYHVSFQWNPNGPDWGDICWGSATSPDMVNWTVLHEPTLLPDTDYDDKGVFTGCFINGRDAALTYAYTSVSALPIHHTLLHPKGCESLSVAKSFDDGKTWQKVAANPVLPSEPEHLDVTGWRDPYVSSWPSMAKVLGLDESNALFGIISGGIRDVTPTTFLYTVDAGDLTRWTYISPLVDFGLNMRPSRWSGDLGRNWEVTNFLTLSDEIDPTITREFLVMGTEGWIEDEVPSESQILSRPSRGQLWMSGDLERKEAQGGVAANMSYNFGGHLDYGCLYAANSFVDPQSKRPVVWGWIPEDDLCDDLRHAQGWSGMLSMPRELRMQTLHHVIGTCGSRLKDITSIEVFEDHFGSNTVRTLASEPLRSLVQSLRAGPHARHSRIEGIRLGAMLEACALPPGALTTSKWELQCSVKVSRDCRRAGLRMLHSEDCSQSTTLAFEPLNETFTIDRPSFASLSSADSSDLINRKSEQAPHTLFVTRDPASGAEEMETLDISAWRDGSVLEVFVNGRTAISTRLYAADETFGLQFFAEDGVSSSPTELVFAEIWDDIGLPSRE